MARILILVLLSVLPASAQAADPATRDKPKDRTVCRAIEDTGSRISRGQDCRPASEWEAIDAASNDKAKSFMGGITSRSGTATDLGRMGGVSASN